MNRRGFLRAFAVLAGAAALPLPAAAGVRSQFPRLVVATNLCEYAFDTDKEMWSDGAGLGGFLGEVTILSERTQTVSSIEFVWPIGRRFSVCRGCLPIVMCAGDTLIVHGSEIDGGRMEGIDEV